MMNEDKTSSELPRLAYTLQETAQMLGISYISVFRLVQRGKLRTSKMLGKHLVPKGEIEKLLKDSLGVHSA